ncbi:hypothetical protein KEJ50_02390 [Candidatus Bathyarchaeota archaeon]|nr:hypothetical protein [Candidatus Bathyarchaeota archaeon]
MKRLGKILHASKSRSLIVKLEKPNPPKLGSKIFDEKLKEIGVVTDVFGPSTSPYISIKPLSSKIENYIGKVVYALKD